MAVYLSIKKIIENIMVNALIIAINKGKIEHKLVKKHFKKKLIYKGCSIRIYRLNGQRRGVFNKLLLNATTGG